MKHVINYQVVMNKNFGLTITEFELLAKEVQEGNNQRFDQVFLAHFQDCLHYLRFNYKATHTDAYDASMEALLIFHKRIREGKVQYGNLRFLFTQIAGQYYLRWIKRENMKESLPASFDVIEENASLSEENLKTLEKAWGGLCGKCSKILKAFYYDSIKLNDLAVQMDISPSTMRKQKQRCVENLRDLFGQYS